MQQLLLLGKVKQLGCGLVLGAVGQVSGKVDCAVWTCDRG
jgi:hypothetical protein